MGQQQLFLIVSGIIVTLIGLASGTYIFSDRSEQATYDALSQEAFRVAPRMMSWKLTPTTFGGGASTTYAEGLTFGGLGYPESNGAGTKSNDSEFKRTISGLNSKRPRIRIQHARDKHLRVDLFIYGVASNCYKLRRARKVDGTWLNSSLPVGKNNPPEGCSVW